jgi:hypothetical protein
VKSAFGPGVRPIVAALARVKKGSAQERRAAAFREASMPVRAMVIARASDSAAARAVLDACGRQ